MSLSDKEASGEKSKEENNGIDWPGTLKRYGTMALLGTALTLFGYFNKQSAAKDAPDKAIELSEGKPSVLEDTNPPVENSSDQEKRKPSGTDFMQLTQ